MDQNCACEGALSACMKRFLLTPHRKLVQEPEAGSKCLFSPFVLASSQDLADSSEQSSQTQAGEMSSRGSGHSTDWKSKGHWDIVMF